jgi:hypothetical protein
MMSTSLFSLERAEEVFSEAQLPAVLAIGGLASTFSLTGMAI